MPRRLTPWTVQPAARAAKVPNYLHPSYRGLLRLVTSDGDLLGGTVTKTGTVPDVGTNGVLVSNNNESNAGTATAVSNYWSFPTLPSGAVSVLFCGVRPSTPAVNAIANMFSTGKANDNAGIECNAGKGATGVNSYYAAFNGAISPTVLIYVNGAQDVGNAPAANNTITNTVPFCYVATYSDSIAGPRNDVFRIFDNFGLGNFTAPLKFALLAQWSRVLSPAEATSLSSNPWQLFAPLSRQIPVVSGTISHPGSDVSVAGWTFNGASLSASIGETTRDDAFYAEAAYGVSGAITALTQSLPAGSYIVTFAGEYLSAAAASGQFRFTALDGSNTSLGVSAWQSVTSAYAQYAVALTVTGGTAVRIKIEIQA
jgi:hypothetical protein